VKNDEKSRLLELCPLFYGERSSTLVKLRYRITKGVSNVEEAPGQGSPWGKSYASFPSLTFLGVR
jgi:hypothetical protein